MRPVPDRTIVDLRGVSLRYRLASQRVGSLKEYLIHFVRGSLRYRELWALSDIDLSIRSGEVVGVIGPNGAGKSTLAKVVSGVLKPSAGERIVHGRVSPILELGTGFDNELTGLENIYLNAMFLGRRRSEIEQRLEAIIDFSGIRDFIHSPIRNYSTGMVARLAFAVATAWVPDLLVLDEVLAVGDARFLGRCGHRIRTMREQGATILLVSHTPQQILDHCTRCIWLEKGILRGDGRPEDVLAHYMEKMQRPRDASSPGGSAGAAPQAPTDGDREAALEVSTAT